ncbi:leader peptidase (prepilin peptidase)/N-methyltransferase [Jatrophihabitans sp. GAS493]|uniref:prepilin peptidase n=1 Tax=Jatrophihabitans sp. GAS493 TaxID=1907575 RepID=UPI000BB8456F|nr:A24 family peptidase [Jatrophihabitans sp. GAS493]SOD74775.1 leader peptidase (prepilin peptidase)/N-methyltransferase [Jatrophihabitans sp. GAS493]
MAVIVALFAVLGLAIGSFLNVVIYRVPRGESLLFPSSHCPSCDSPIKNRHNVPVLGWLVLRGRCASCREPISPRYPLVEAATGLLFAAMTAHFGLTVELPAYLYLSALVVTLTMIDIDTKRLPNAIVLPSYAVGVALLVLAAIVNHDWTPALRAVGAMAALWSIFFAIVMIQPGGMGFGDVKLAGLLGLFLGSISWSAVIVAGFGGFVLGGVVGVALLLSHRAGRKSAIPFGPFMLTAAVLAMFVSTPIASWYGTLAGIG